MQKSVASIGNAWRLEKSDSDENDLTQPLLIISSRTSHPGIPRKPRGSWFKKSKQLGGDRTPDFIEIGDPSS